MPGIAVITDGAKSNISHYTNQAEAAVSLSPPSTLGVVDTVG